MTARKRETIPKTTRRRTGDTGRPLKARFDVTGEELIEKEVKQCGEIGRVYLPPDWVDKHVKIIRID